MSRRELGLLLTGVLVLALAAASLSPAAPRLLWTNAGLSVSHPWPRGAAALGAAAASVLFAALASRRALRAGGIVGVLACSWLGARLLTYRVEAGPTLLVERGLIGSTAVAWADAARVDLRPGELVVTAVSGARIRIVTGGWDPHGVAQLERTISRRVREAAP